MKRREFMTLIGGAAASSLWPLVARAQQPAMPVVGFLSSGAPGPIAYAMPAFRAGLSEAGFTEGQNVAIEYRWPENQYDRLPALVADLVSRKVAVIAAVGGPASGLAVKATNTSIPLVFVSGTDPVKLGLVASFNRPGGSATGVNILSTAIHAKRFGLLHELVPAAMKFACIVIPDSPEADAQISNVQDAARTIGREVRIFKAGGERELDAAFAAIQAGRASGVRGPNPQLSARANHSARGTQRASRHLRVARLRSGRWADELRTELN